MPCPKKLKQIPAYAINIGLAGVHLSQDNDKRLLVDFLKRQLSFKIKILFCIQDKYYVEVFNEKGVSLNTLINPRFQNEIYGMKSKDGDS